MEATPVDSVVRELLQEIGGNLSRAAAIANAAIVLANKDQLKAAVRLVMDIEDPAHRSDRLLQAILLIYTELQCETID
jgi:hypothetical protein